MSPKVKKILFESLVVSDVVLFTYAASSKLQDLGNFKVQISRIVPYYWATPIVAYGLPVVELMIAVLLILQNTRLIGLWSFIALMCIFSLYISYWLLNKASLPCSCGGVLHFMDWKTHLSFNIFFIAMNAIGLKWNPYQKIIRMKQL